MSLSISITSISTTLMGPFTSVTHKRNLKLLGNKLVGLFVVYLLLIVLFKFGLPVDISCILRSYSRIQEGTDRVQIPLLFFFNRDKEQKCSFARAGIYTANFGRFKEIPALT